MGWLLAAGDRVACYRDVEQWQDFPRLVAGSSLCRGASDSRLAMLVITCTDNTHPHTLAQSYSHNTHNTFSFKPKQTVALKASINVDPKNALEGHF